MRNYGVTKDVVCRLQVHGLSHRKQLPPWPAHWHHLAQT